MQYTTVQSPDDVRDILALQAENHKSVLDEATRLQNGFVTVKHDFDLLWRMNQAYPSVIAREGAVLAGYCLMMPRTFRHDIPILAPMFNRLDVLSWHERPLADQRWFIMGQICVGAPFRGQSVFDLMYAHLRTVWQPHFDFVITEVSENNPRSMRAHERVGFQTLHAYTNPETGENWRVIVWDW